MLKADNRARFSQRAWLVVFALVALSLPTQLGVQGCINLGASNDDPEEDPTDLSALDLARADQPLDSTLVVAEALRAKLSAAELQYLLLLRWEKLPEADPEVMLADPVVVRALQVAAESRTHSHASNKAWLRELVLPQAHAAGCPARLGRGLRALDPTVLRRSQSDGHAQRVADHAYS